MDKIQEYQAPKNSLPEVGNIEFSKRIICTLSILPPMALYILSYKIIPQFFETFSVFGTDLPKETLFVLTIYPALIWLAVLSCFPVLIWLNDMLSLKAQKIIFSLSIGHVFFSFIALIFLIWSLYAPIVAMAK